MTFQYKISLSEGFKYLEINFGDLDKIIKRFNTFNCFNNNP